MHSAPTLCGSAGRTTNSLIDVFDFSITGPDAAFFEVNSFAPTLLQAGYADSISYDLTFLGGDTGLYSALLTFTASEGDVLYSLAAAVVPEPSALMIWCVALAALGWRRLRPQSRCWGAASLTRLRTSPQ